MTYRLLTGGLVAGIAAGLIAALLHFAFVQNLILLGEQYETGAMVGEAAPGAAGANSGHGHDSAHAGAAGQGGEVEQSAVSRNLLTVLFTCLIYSSYGLLLISGFAVAERFGARVGFVQGVLWGIAGFAALQLAPAMGLAPELPGSAAAELTQRQIWWLGTVAATAAGLALLAYGRGVGWMSAGIALLAAPHLIGAPLPEGFAGGTHGSAPPELAAAFSARVLGVGMAAWAILGGVAGRLWSTTESRT